MKLQICLSAILLAFMFLGCQNIRAENERLYGVGYGPFRGQQDPDSGLYPSRQEMTDDIGLVAKTAKALRTYSAGDTPSLIPAICDEAGIDCCFGIWLGKEKDENRREIEAGVKVANENHKSLKILVVGNEVLLRGDLKPDELITYISEVRERTKSVAGLKITTGETWGLVLKHPEVAKHLDFVMPHIYAYWDGIPIEDAAKYVIEVWKKVQLEFPDKDVVIGETGWPSVGTAHERAQPSPENQARFFSEFVGLAKANGIKYFYFEMFDEQWKEKFEGKVGGFWGIFDSAGAVKKNNEPFVTVASRAGIKRPVQEITAREIALPIIVYDDDRANKSNFFPSGWMGDQKPIELDRACTVNPHGGKTCLKITYSPPLRASWSGIYWQYPLNNWGKYPGYKVQGTANELRFWARGENGGERSEFKVGGIYDRKLPNRDSFGPKSSGVITLTKEWKQYSISLKGADLSNLIGGFCWTTNNTQNAGKCVIYLDDIEIVP